MSGFASRTWGENVISALAEGACAGENQTVQSVLGLGVKQVRAEEYIPIGWKIVHPSHSVTQYQGITWCGMDFSISVQIEHAMLWDDQGVSASRFPATEQEEMLENGHSHRQLWRQLRLE